MTRTCEGPGCSVQFEPDPRVPNHKYHDSRCKRAAWDERKAARRTAETVVSVAAQYELGGIIGGSLRLRALVAIDEAETRGADCADLRARLG